MTVNSLKKKMISGVMVGSVITSLGVTAFASDLNQSQANPKESIKQGVELKNKQGKQENVKHIEHLKESGVFNESEIEKIETYLESKKAELDKERENLKGKTEEERKAYFEANKDNKQNMMDELVADGVITQDQLDKLKETMPQRGQFDRQNGKGLQGKPVGDHKGNLGNTEGLKKSGIFTESEIEKIETYLESKKSELDKERENLKGKTEEERKAYFEANKGNKQNMMDELVADGVITQDQLDKLKETMPQKCQLKNK